MRALQADRRVRVCVRWIGVTATAALAAGNVAGCVAYEIREELGAVRTSLDAMHERVAAIEEAMVGASDEPRAEAGDESLTAAVRRIDRNLTELRRAVEGMIDNIPLIDVDELNRRRQQETR